MRVLGRLGLLPRIRAAGAEVFNGMRVISPGGQEIVLDYSADAGRHALGLSRWALDRIAVERCQELGVHLLEGARLREVQVSAMQPAVVTVSRGGAVSELRGRVLVGADGHHSAVSRLLSLDVPLRWPRRIGLAAHLEGFPLAGNVGEMHVGQGSYCGFAPQEDGRVNAAMVLDMDRFDRRPASADAFFDAALHAYPGLAQRVASAVRVTPVRGVGPLARKVRQVYGDGYVLVGDAAGFFDPFTGEGIYDALHGGELAAQAIGRALERGEFTARVLSEYERARRQVFGAKRCAGWLVQAFIRSPALMDYAIDRLAVRPLEASTMTGVLGDYRDAGTMLSPRYLWRVLRP
jgi:flavin-dependent dehydrogenase